MSQHNVEQVIGRLVTDEGFRRRFTADPRAVVGELVDNGLTLNRCEQRGLVALDPGRLARFAATLHPCIQKVELPGADAATDLASERTESRGDAGSEPGDVENAAPGST